MNESRARAILEGVAAGLVGFAVVALLFALLNLVQGRSIFYTAALLGGDLFYGLESPADVVIAPGPVLAYNGVHLLAFLVAGGVLRWLVGVAERIPQGWYLLVMVFFIVAPHALGLPVWFEGPVQAEVPLWYVIMSTTLAAAAMAGLLLALHPRLRASMAEYRDE